MEAQISVDGQLDKEELLVFGYESKLFRDDERAEWIDSKQHLVPWNGNKNLMIDRFDVRGLLLDQREFDADFVPQDRRTLFAPEEAGIEKLCEEERYLALNRDLQAEKEKEEEEWKRYQEALQEGFHAIGHEYETKEYDPMEPTEDEYPDTINLDEHVNNGVAAVSHISRQEQKYEQPILQPTSDENAKSVSEDSDASQPYVIPKGLIIPHDMHLPDTAKLGVVIEKTAQLVATQGAQMEVLLKTKQSNNSSFNFLNYNSILHPFYMFILTMIKSRRYVPQPQLPPPPTQSQTTREAGDKSSGHSQNNNTSPNSSSKQAKRPAPKASVVIDHSKGATGDSTSSGESSDDSDSDTDSDSSGGGYLHPLLAGGGGAGIGITVASSKNTSNKSDNQKSESSLVSNNNNTQSVLSSNTDKKKESERDESDSVNLAVKLKQEAEELERRKREGLLQLCHQRAMTRLYYDGLSHIPVVPPPPDTQPTVDRVAREVSQQTEPDSYEERLRQSHLEALESGGTTGSSGDSAQEYIDKRFLWPQDTNHVYYRFKKYFYLECLSLFGCCDPEEEQRKKEEAERQLETKKAEAEAEAKAAKKRQLPPGPVKFSISPGAKRLKISGGAGGGVSEMCKESALPYESSDEGEEEETEAAENILQDEEKSGVAVDKSKFKSIESTSSQDSEAENEDTEDDDDDDDENESKLGTKGSSKSPANDDPDAAIRAMTAFLSELEARNPDPAPDETNTSLNNRSPARLNETESMPMSQYEKTLQAERKRKASMFLLRLKKNNELNSNQKKDSPTQEAPDNASSADNEEREEIKSHSPSKQQQDIREEDQSESGSTENIPEDV